MSNVDEILRYKELLDNEIITKEEFEKKKNELLNIKTTSESETSFKHQEENNIDYTATYETNINAVNDWIDLLLCIFFGIVGAHLFYEKRYKIGLVYLFTFGLLGFGWFKDVVLKLIGLMKYIANDNKRIKKFFIILITISFLAGFAKIIEETDLLENINRTKDNSPKTQNERKIYKQRW